MSRSGKRGGVDVVSFVIVAVGGILAITSTLIFVYLKPKLKAADQAADIGFELKIIGPTTFSNGAAGVGAQFTF